MACKAARRSLRGVANGILEQHGGEKSSCYFPVYRLFLKGFLNHVGIPIIFVRILTENTAENL